MDKVIDHITRIYHEKILQSLFCMYGGQSRACCRA